MHPPVHYVLLPCQVTTAGVSLFCTLKTEQRSKIMHHRKEIEIKESVGQKLDELDKSKIFLIEKYQQIISLIKQIGASYNEHYLFQVDMNRGVVKASLGNDIIKELQSALILLALLSLL